MVTIAFWCALLLPGYAVARMVAPRDLESGLPGALAVSFLAALVVLSPVSILCYLLSCPVAVLSSACILVLIAGVVQISRRGWWRDIAKLVAGGLGIELLILVTDVVIGGRVGAFLGGGDERMHLARVRFLLDHGFSNVSPYTHPGGFFNVYNTNLLHGLYASCSQLSGVDVPGAWCASLVLAKSLIAGAYYFLAWSVFDRRWVAWCVALFAVVLYAPVTYVTYPNKLAPHWLFPLAAAFAVQASDRHCPGRIPIKLGATALVLGQVHSLYAVFTGIALAPGLLWAFLGRLRRGGVDLWQAAACLAALWLGSPFALAARRVDVAVDVAVDVEHTVVTEQSSDFFHFSNDWVMLKPSFLQHPRGLAMFALAVAGVGCSLSGRSRVRSAHLTAAAATVSCVLFVPPLCAGAVALLGGEWVAARMLALATASIIALGVGGLASIVEPFTSRSRLLSSAGAGVVCLAAAFTPADAAGRWHDYLTSARAPVEQRHHALRHLRELRAFLQAHIPPGDTVLADPQTSMWLVMLHDCYVVATASGSTVLDMEQRRADVQTIVGPRTPWSARRELLRKYGVTRCMVDTRVLPERALSWARGHLAERPIHHGPYVLVALDTER